MQCEKLKGPRRAILAINPVGRHAMADFEEAPLSLCFHYAQAVVKRLTKINVKKTVVYTHVNGE